MAQVGKLPAFSNKRLELSCCSMSRASFSRATVIRKPEVSRVSQIKAPHLISLFPIESRHSHVIGNTSWWQNHARSLQAFLLYIPICRVMPSIYLCAIEVDVGNFQNNSIGPCHQQSVIGEILTLPSPLIIRLDRPLSTSTMPLALSWIATIYSH